MRLWPQMKGLYNINRICSLAARPPILVSRISRFLIALVCEGSSGGFIPWRPPKRCEVKPTMCQSLGITRYDFVGLKTHASKSSKRHSMAWGYPESPFLSVPLHTARTVGREEGRKGKTRQISGTTHTHTRARAGNNGEKIKYIPEQPLSLVSLPLLLFYCSC